MTIQVIPVPDIGGAEDVDVIEVCVAPGDAVDAEQSLIVLETDKASMEVPSPLAGKVVALKVNEGDTVSEGDAIVELEVGQEQAAGEPTAGEPTAGEPARVDAAPAGDPAAAQPATAAAAVETAAGPTELPVAVPDIGGAEDVDVIEVCVAEGDEVAEGDSLIVLETDKASMEIPAPAAGKVLSLALKEGAKVAEGDAILTLAVAAAAAPLPAAEPQAPAPAAAPAAAAAPGSGPPITAPAAVAPEAEPAAAGSGDVYAGPSVRKLARQLGVDLGEVKASGPRSRHTKDDIRAYVKALVDKKPAAGAAAGGAIAPIPEVDFSKFGAVELVKMSKIKKVTAANMARNWLNVPHVTQFDDADVSDMEAFRKEMKAEAEARGVKLTPLAFLLKAAAAALRYEPSFNVSLHADGEHIVQKDYVHIGVAVATPAGLLVPVIRDVDKKGLWQLAAESAQLAQQARDGKLLPRDMQGACFTISSLGAIGGTGFTPIVNAPEVAILGVSKAAVQPVWNGTDFVPRQMLPVALSYDHRAINGADAGRFFTHFVSILGDIRRLLL